ncbi:MAG: hypothetical protein AAF515_03375 [Pseudomonadota bacterium]
MLARSLVACLLSFPATIALVGLFLLATSGAPALRLPSLLMIFPIWVGLASASYLIPHTGKAAALLTGVSLAGFAAIALLRYLGVSA